MSDSMKRDAYGNEIIPLHMITNDLGHIRKTRTDVSPLKSTISDVGLLQPILVKKGTEGYVIVDGARRLQALKELEVPELIVGRDIVIDTEDRAADHKFKQIIANIQREAINDIELGHAFVMMKAMFGYQYNEIAEIIGKSPHYVTSKVGLAKRLNAEVQSRVANDMDRAKCIPDTFFKGDQARVPLYVVNITVLEDIARLPPELQSQAYQTICEYKMGKQEALEYLRSIKRGDSERLRDDGQELIEACQADEPQSDKRICDLLHKVSKDIDIFIEQVKFADPDSQEMMRPFVEDLIERLTYLRSYYRQIGYRKFHTAAGRSSYEAISIPARPSASAAEADFADVSFRRA